MGVKENIISAAYELLLRQGYDDTSVQQIVDASGSSKGGFYHHFKTKDDVIEAIGENILKNFEERYKALASDKKNNVYDLMSSVMSYVFEYNISVMKNWSGIAKMLSFDGSVKIKAMITKRFEGITAECYYSLIKRGIRGGEFNTEYPKQLAGTISREIILVYADLSRLALDYSSERYTDFVNLLEYLHGLINGQLGLKVQRIDIKDQALAYFEKIKDKAKAIKKE